MCRVILKYVFVCANVYDIASVLKNMINLSKYTNTCFINKNK